MGPADQFRKRAMDCLLLAETATNVDSRTHWLTMSMLWTKLADHAREREKIEGTLSKGDSKRRDGGRSESC